jgi:hypothetical protein
MSVISKDAPARGRPGMWQVCSPDTDRSAWHPFLATFFSYWLAIRPGADLLPGRQHFDPVDIGTVMSRVWLLDVVRDGVEMRFRYRLVGTKEVETLQQEVTGKWFDDVHPRLKETPAHLERYRFVAAQGQPTYRKGAVNFAHKREHAHVENCLVPLARDGRTVDILAACSVLYQLDGREI